jgi:hypothetical protein
VAVIRCATPINGCSSAPLYALGSGERDAKAGLDKSASAIAQAVGDSAVGRWASGRLDARRNRAGELYGLADALGVVDALRLWELEPADLRALGLYGESSADA